MMIAGKYFHETETRLASQQESPPDLAQAKGQEIIQQVTFAHGQEDIPVGGALAQDGAPDDGAHRQPGKPHDQYRQYKAVIRRTDGFEKSIQVNKIEDGSNGSQADDYPGQPTAGRFPEICHEIHPTQRAQIPKVPGQVNKKVFVPIVFRS